MELVPGPGVFPLQKNEKGISGTSPELEVCSMTRGEPFGRKRRHFLRLDGAFSSSNYGKRIMGHRDADTFGHFRYDVFECLPF